VASFTEKRCKTVGSFHVAEATPTSSRPGRPTRAAAIRLKCASRVDTDEERDHKVPGKPEHSVAPSERAGTLETGPAEKLVPARKCRMGRSATRSAQRSEERR